MKKPNPVLEEARRLHADGFAVHWLKRRSKIPVFKGWTTGPRATWEKLKATYQPGFNIGVRTGTASKLANGFLAAIDVDVKSKNPRHKEEALKAAHALLGDVRPPMVRSGRGGGSRHYYVATKEPFGQLDVASSSDRVRVLIPGSVPSEEDQVKFTESELARGWRTRPAWGVSVYSDRRQMVLPPSVHPDTGASYEWARPVSGSLPRLKFKGAVKAAPTKGGVLEHRPVINDWSPTDAEVGWLPIGDDVRAGIVQGVPVGRRSEFLLKAASALFSVGLPTNDVLTILSDPANAISACAFEHTGMTGSRKDAVNWLLRYTVDRIGRERKGVAASGVSVFENVPLVEAPMVSWEKLALMEDPKAHAWEDDLVRGEKRIPMKLVQNVVTILANRFGPDVVRRDEFAYRDTYSRKVPWAAKKGTIVSDDDLSTIRYWLGCNYKFEPPDTVISSALIVLARRNTYDPVKEMLSALPAWDGNPRLNTWLARHFEAKDDAEYLAQVFRKWMFAMILRVYKPGAKFDWMPIFEGTQGIGKSSFGRLLVGDQYFLDWLPNLHDKDAALGLQGMWGVELGELSQFRRNELESIKAFLTRTVDKLRPPYGRRSIESPRRCVFFGTTNRTTYLIDETGNRRFKPVMVGSLDFKALKRDREQLLAEAKHLYDTDAESEVTLELTGAARAYEAKIHPTKMVEDDSHSMEQALHDYFEKDAEDRTAIDPDKFRILELFRQTGPLAGWKQENRNLQFAAKALRRLRGVSRDIKGYPHWKIPVAKVFPDF